MLRITFFAALFLLPLLAFSSFLATVLDIGPQVGRIDPSGTSLRIVLSVWLLETVGLVVLFLVVEGRCGTWWLDGLVTGAIAWIFRGPLVVVTVVSAAGGDQEPWWHLALLWWVVYSSAGLILASLRRPRHEAALPREL